MPARKDFSKENWHLLIFSIFCFLLGVKFIEDIVSSDKITEFDLWLSQQVVHFWQPWLNKLVIFITYVADTKTVIVLSAIMVVYLLYRKKKDLLLLFISSIGLGLLTYTLLNAIVQRTRPENYLIWTPHFSFPSGHTLMATVFFLFLMFAFKDEIKNKILKILYIISCISLFLFIGLSRIYLNAHWFSDVSASICIGIFWFTALLLLMKITAQFKKSKVFFVVMVIILLIGAVLGGKMLSDEDDWICTKGEWQKHGNPSAPRPTEPCP